MQLYDNGTFEGIEVDSLTPEDYARIITSSMFLKEKYRADGSFEKLKARLEFIVKDRFWYTAQMQYAEDIEGIFEECLSN